MTTNTVSAYGYVDLTGLWATRSPRPPGSQDPLVSLSDIPSASVDWLNSEVPELAAPEDLDMDTLALIVGALQTAITGLLSQVNSATIDHNRYQKKADFERAQQKEAEARQKAKEAEDAADKAKVGEWVAMIAQVIGAVLAVIGAMILGANPFLVAAAVFAVIGAVQAVVNMGLKEANGGKGVKTKDALGNDQQLELSWGAAVQALQARLVADGSILRRDDKGNVIDAKGNKMTAEQVKAATDKNPFVKIMTEDDMAKERLGATVAIEIVMAVAMIGCGAQGMAVAAAKAAKTASSIATTAAKSTRLGIEASNKTWEKLGQLTEVVTAVTEGVSGGGDIACATYSGIGAHSQWLSDDARAEQHFYEKKMKAMLAAMRDLEDMLKRLVKSLNDSYEAMSGQIKEIDESRSTIARNIVKVN